MAYIFIVIVVLVVCFSIIKAFKKKRLPSNNYTPFDDMERGKADKD